MKNSERTPVQIAEDNKIRILSDAELIRSGAAANSDGSLDFENAGDPKINIDIIDKKREEMELDLYARKIGKIFNRDELGTLIKALQGLSQTEALNKVGNSLLDKFQKAFKIIHSVTHRT